MTILQLYAKHRVGEGFDHRSVLLDSYLFGHVKITL